MKIVLEKAETLQKSVNSISALIDEAEFVANENGLALKAADPSQISMVDFSIAREAFKEFDVKEETKIGLDLSYLNQIMTRAKPSDELTLEVADNNLKATFRGTSTRSFDIPLLDLSSTIGELPNPQINETSTASITAIILSDGFKDALLVSSHASIGVEGNKFAIKTKSSKGNFELQIEKGNKNLLEISSTEESLSTFPLDYLQDMLKGTYTNTVVGLRMKKDSPIEISYKIGEAEIKYFLAPRIEAD